MQYIHAGTAMVSCPLSSSTGVVEGLAPGHLSGEGNEGPTQIYLSDPED